MEAVTYKTKKIRILPKVTLVNLCIHASLSSKEEGTTKQEGVLVVM